MEGQVSEFANSVCANALRNPLHVPLLENDSLLRLLPEMTRDELDSYRDHRYEQLRRNA
jgi:hypothetical protein